MWSGDHCRSTFLVRVKYRLWVGRYLDVLHDDGGELLVADVLVRVPLEQDPLDDLLPLVLRQFPRLLQGVAHVQHHLLHGYLVVLLSLIHI